MKYRNISHFSDDPELWDFTLDGIDMLDNHGTGSTEPPRPTTPSQHKMTTRSKTPQRVQNLRPPAQPPGHAVPQGQGRYGQYRSSDMTTTAGAGTVWHVCRINTCSFKKNCNYARIYIPSFGFASSLMQTPHVPININSQGLHTLRAGILWPTIRNKSVLVDLACSLRGNNFCFL